MPNALKVKDGQRFVGGEAERWVVGCAQHRGQEPIGHETRIDPATKKPREAWRPDTDEDGSPVLDDLGAIVGSMQVVEFPVYATDVGFQSDCEACQAGLVNLHTHHLAVQADRVQAAHDLQRQVAAARARGETV